MSDVRMLTENIELGEVKTANCFNFTQTEESQEEGGSKTSQTSHTYGSLRLRYNDERCTARPKYLRFSTQAGSNTSRDLLKLLRDRWGLPEPTFLVQIFEGNEEYGEKKSRDPVKIELLQKLIQIFNEQNSWINMFDEYFYADFITQTKSLLRQSVISKSNIVYWKNWQSLTNEERKTLTPHEQYLRGKQEYLYESEWRYKELSKSNLVHQSSVFLFPDDIADEETWLEERLKFISSLSEEQCKEHRLINNSETLSKVRSCMPVNIYIGRGRQISSYILRTCCDTVKNAPLLIITDDENDSCSYYPNVYFVKENSSLEELREEINETLKYLYNHDSDSENEDDNPDITQTCADLYLSMKLNNMERCSRIVEKEEAPGLQQDMVQLLHYHHCSQVLGTCIANGSYDLNTCLYGNTKMIPYRHPNNNLVKLFLTEIKGMKGLKLKQALLKFINKNLDYCLSIPDTEEALDENQHWLYYMLFYLNQEWDLCRLIRQHYDYPVMRCLLSLKHLKTIRQLQLSGFTEDYYNPESLDNEITALEAEVTGIIKSSDEQGLDTGGIVFYEHPPFTDYCVLSLADEIHSIGVFNKTTNVNGVLTERWNQDIEPSTCILSFVISWLSLGLIAPFIISFIKDKGVKSDNRLKQVKARKDSYFELWVKFWRSPRNKCYLLMVTYCVFLGLLIAIVLDNTSQAPQLAPSKLRFLVPIAFIFVISFLLMELNLTKVNKLNRRRKWNSYISSGYNKLDLFSAASYILYTLIYFITTPQSDRNIFFLSKLIVSLSFIGYMIRCTQFLQMFEAIGPKLISIKKMFADLLFFAVFLLITIVTYGIVSEFLVHPYARAVGWSEVADILKRPYVNMFGDLDLDSFESSITEGVCKYEVYSNTSLSDAEVTAGLENCDGAESCRELCQRFKLIARLLLGVYTMATVVLLTNLLISIFSKTYEHDYDENYELWQIQRFKLIQEFEDHFVLPFPPFNIFYSLYRLVKSFSASNTRLICEEAVQTAKETEYHASRIFYKDQNTG